MEGCFSGIAFSSSVSSGRFPTSSSRSSDGRSKVEKQSPENWKDAFRGLLFPVVFAVVVIVVGVVVVVVTVVVVVVAVALLVVVVLGRT